MKTVLLLALSFLLQTTAYAADTTPASPAVVDTEMQAARAHIAKKDWPAAIATLEPYTKATPKSADGFNLLGYSYRHMKRYDDAFVAYKQALTLDPKHRGAHEYIGKAYILTGQPEKAREHLALLDKICTFSCEEYRDLKKALDAVK